MRRIVKLINTLLGVGVSEYAGFLWLFVTLIVCSAGLFVADKLSGNPYDSYEKDAAILDSLLEKMGAPKETAFVVESASIELFPFDPNTVDGRQLIQLGFPEWLSRQLINYRNKGGYFRSADDLLKLYNFPDSLFVKIAPYVKIKPKESNNNQPLKKEKQVTKKFKPEVKKTVSFDLNIADTSVFQTVKGIGSTLSRRIVTYRDKLGGFWSYDQLYEVYYLDSTVIDDLKKVAFIQRDFNPKKIEINAVNEKELVSHPYVNYKQAKLIIAYRNQHGNFANRESLLNVYSINNGWLEKIDPYLSF